MRQSTPRFATRGFGGVLLASLFLLSSCQVSPSPPSAPPVELLKPTVIQSFPFDKSSFTQGLEAESSDTLLIGTGQKGQSRVYRSTLAGQELQSSPIDPEIFGEGITRTDSAIWQLTWKDHQLIQRDVDTLMPVRRLPLPTEGWGICHQESGIYYSDGSSIVRRLNPDTLTVEEQVNVTQAGQPVPGLNELECVGNDIWANVFPTHRIVRIDSHTGAVTASVDASNLLSHADPDPNNVLNGIAFLPESGHFLLSGKRWPQLYEVRMDPVSPEN
ncbi:glutaminyl-peptide cyclotransferase [Corynebacterium poyangense]|uniref:Glutaminyl-peptide cyclotransferase n=1 Tax=Corynebacterium poyangense TaxID=2684405 RepID=A0A7H0SMR4_9CORY|nr:glutaminyl-peptide cyclotransferase [Corynebacterium poyangense]MBZ8176335.1 glutaminyl-peptide cyclotransferase [Corynebacterium poyangense]QNQ89839.1 glutaminyl-peptide cyclotransferase [Corynebacterium poyangense]